MKRILKALTGILAVCSFTLLTVFTAGAAEKSQETEVRFTVSQDGRYELSVEAAGNGEIRDGEKSIRNGAVEYQLSVGETKTFRIVPDEGYRIGSVIYEQPEISRIQDFTEQALAGEIEIVMESTGGILRIEFVVDPSGSGGTQGGSGGTSQDSGSGGSAGADAAQTGDTAGAAGYAAAVIGAGAVVIYLYRKKKRSDIQKAEH